MCLGFDYAAAIKGAHDAAATLALTGAMKALEKARHDVDCDNVQQYVIDLKDKSTLKMDLLPASSDTCVCYMYPINPACLGEGDKYLIPSDTIPCQASMFDGIHHPEKYVPKPRLIIVDVYRSLGSDGCGGGTQVIMPEVKLPEGSCVKNADGSVTFTLKLSTIVKTDAEVEAAIASGEFSDRVAYNLAMGKACYNELLRNMDKNGVESKNLFAMRDDDPTQVDPEAMLNFLDMLHPNLIPGKDIVVGIPAFDETGKAKGAAFSLWFHYPEGVQYLPLLGLVHNVDPSDPSPTSKVEGNFYVATNKKRGIGASDEKGGGRSIRLRSHEDFLPDIAHHMYESGFDKDALAGVSDDEEPRTDWSAWHTACSAFQKNCQSSIWDSLEDLVNKNGLPGFDKSVMVTTNLKDMEFPKQTMTMGRDKRSRKEASAVDEDHSPKRAKSPAAPDITEVEMEDVANMSEVPDKMSDFDNGMISMQFGIGKVHSILSRVNSDKWDAAIVALVKGLDSNYFNDKAVGISRFNLELMTEPHGKCLLAFLEGITGTA